MATLTIASFYIEEDVEREANALARKVGASVLNIEDNPADALHARVSFHAADRRTLERLAVEYVGDAVLAVTYFGDIR